MGIVEEFHNKSVIAWVIVKDSHNGETRFSNKFL